MQKYWHLLLLLFLCWSFRRMDLTFKFYPLVLRPPPQSFPTHTITRLLQKGHNERQLISSLVFTWTTKKRATTISQTHFRNGNSGSGILALYSKGNLLLVWGGMNKALLGCHCSSNDMSLQDWLLARIGTRWSTNKNGKVIPAANISHTGEKKAKVWPTGATVLVPPELNTPVLQHSRHLMISREVPASATLVSIH